MKTPIRSMLLAPLATAAIAFAQAPAEPAAQPAEAAEPAPAAAAQVQRAPRGTEAPAPDAAKPVSAAAHNAAAAIQRTPIDRIIDAVLEPLELTEEQATSIDAIRQAWLERTEPLRAEIRALFLAAHAQRQSAGTSPADIEAKRAELTAAQAEMQKEIDGLDQQIAAQLDEGQRTKYLQMREQMRARTGEGSDRPSPGARPAPKASNSGR